MKSRGFTLLELLVTMAIVSVLAVTALATYKHIVVSAKKSQSSGNLHQLCVANIAYATDHDGYCCPAMDRRNRIRWHGGRGSTDEAFDPSQGFLSPYLDKEGKLETCPFFKPTVKSDSFEEGAGGYGYNAKYVGGQPGNPYQGESLSSMGNPARTIMFATTALSKSDGLQEYPFAEPYFALSRRGRLAQPLQPSVHFRVDGKALIGWCDGHVTAEPPSQFSDTNYYGGDNKKDQIGWIGPEEENGYWNPFRSPTASNP